MTFGASRPSGLYYYPTYPAAQFDPKPTYLPQLSLQANAVVLSSIARTTFTQTFSNPLPNSIPELRYSFPLYDGVSVASFTCTINRDRVIKGRVYEKRKARETFEDAKARGKTAGLLEQLPAASDVFTTTIGNVPGGAEIRVDIVVLGELKHDAETDGIRFTIPTHIAPRYGSQPNALADTSHAALKTQIIVDVELPTGSLISSLQSPSHPIAIAIGALSTSSGSKSPSPHLASASLALGTAPLDKDFILQVVASNTDNPVAILENHPTIPNQRVLMTTLVPKFNLPDQRPEIVFICDRSGSMGGQKIANLSSALQLFLKSLPLGVTFNVCGFGNGHEFLFPQSRPYDLESLETAMRYAETISANFGGTEIHGPLVDTFKRRNPDMDLEVFLLTDGSVWDQSRLFDTVHHHVTESKGAVRLFTLAIGSDASHSLVEGLARAGKGFSQSVGSNEMMDKKVIRMLKGALTPHIHDYALEVKYKRPDQDISDDDDDFDLIDRVADLAVDVSPAEKTMEAKPEDTPKALVEPISLFDLNFDLNAQIESFGLTAGPANLPSVTIPKILQTPSEIPPLYPFNRTSVYLLMSPETSDKIPESVILRAESKYGPLEVEIPVTTTTTGETIHQLAARKAIHEMEEGRGWIFHAKEKAGNVLLKDAYKAEFAAMVECEAVRLGVQLQVAGKWCSFVAVEGNDGTIVDTPSAPSSKEPRHTPALTKSKVAYASKRTPFAGMVPCGQPSMKYAGSFRRPASRAFEASPFGVPAMEYNNTSMDNTDSLPDFDMDAAALAIVPTPPTFSFVAHSLGSAQAYDPASAITGSGLFGQMSSNLQAAAPASSLTGGGLFSSVGTTGNPKETKLQTIIRLQYFSGLWDAKKEVLDTIGVTEARFAKLLSTAQVSLGNLAIAREIVATTTAVIVFLQTQLASKKDTWDLVVEKALSWLEGFYGTRERVTAAIAEVEVIMG